jgi:RIO kinase 1
MIRFNDTYNILLFILLDFSISEYFKKKGVSTLTVKELFDFVTDISITDDNLDDYLDKCMMITSNRTIDDVTEQDKIDEQVIYLYIVLYCYL